jgi:hypothetical protein
MFGNISLAELSYALSKDPTDIYGNIALPDDDRYFSRQIEAMMAMIGMAIVPSDKINR